MLTIELAITEYKNHYGIISERKIKNIQSEGDGEIRHMQVPHPRFDANTPLPIPPCISSGLREASPHSRWSHKTRTVLLSHTTFINVYLRIECLLVNTIMKVTDCCLFGTVTSIKLHME